MVRLSSMAYSPTNLKGSPSDPQCELFLCTCKAGNAYDTEWKANEHGSRAVETAGVRRVETKSADSWNWATRFVGDSWNSGFHLQSPFAWFPRLGPRRALSPRHISVLIQCFSEVVVMMVLPESGDSSVCILSRRQGYAGLFRQSISRPSYRLWITGVGSIY